jgi:hypothetical protein
LFGGRGEGGEIINVRFVKLENTGHTRLSELTSLGRDYIGGNVNTGGTE